jgi:predicted ATPase
MITELTVRNYRCLANLTLQLGDLTVLVGPNASGKSTILDVLDFMTDALRDSLPTALDRRGGIQLVRRRSGGHPTNVTVEVAFRGRPYGTYAEDVEGRYGFTIKAEPEYAYSVREEHCEVRIGEPPVQRDAWLKREVDAVQISPEAPVPRLDTRRLLLPVLAAYPEFAAVHDILTSVAMYSIQPDELREPQEPTEGQVLRRDGSNAASVLREMMGGRPKDYERLSEALSKVAPGVSSPKSRHRGRQLELTFEVDVGARSPWEFESFLLSDGTLRMLGILIAVGQTRQLQLIGIEEPEATIHPGALAVLVDTLKAASSRTQVVVTTHSPDILDLVPIESVQCVRLVRGQTVVTPPSPAALAAARESLMSPGELMRANALQPDETELATAQQTLW